MARFNQRLHRELGKRIREQREALSISQERLADAVGFTTRSSISNVESGRQKISVETLYDIARVLQTSPDSLLPPPELPTSVKQIRMPDGIPQTRKAWITSLITSEEEQDDETNQLEEIKKNGTKSRKKTRSR